MSTHYPCPNPACTYQFPAPSLVGLPAVTCPLCRMTFQLRGTTAAPPPPTYPPPGIDTMPTTVEPAYTPPTYLPPGYTAPAYGPVTEPAGWPPPAASEGPWGQTAGFAAASAFGGSVRSRPRRRSNRGRDLILTVVISVVVLGGLVALLSYGYSQMNRLFNVERDTPMYQSEELGYRFRPVRGDWRRDDSLRGPFQVDALAYRRSDPSAWFALSVHDQKGRPTTDVDLLAEARRRLGGYFQSLESEPKPDGALGGQPAKRLEFEGEVNGIGMHGHVLTLSYQGVSYWVFGWSPQGEYERARPLLEEMQQRLEFLDQRKAGKSVVREFVGDGYQMRDTEGVWEEFPESTPAKDFDPAGDLALRGTLRGLSPAERKDTLKQAKALVLVLPAAPGGKALEAAKQYFLKRQQANYEKTTLTEEPLTGAPTQVADWPCQAAAYRVQYTEDKDGYVVLAAIAQAERSLVIVCDCERKRQRDWEPEFVRLIGSLRPGPPRLPKKPAMEKAEE